VPAFLALLPVGLFAAPPVQKLCQPFQPLWGCGNAEKYFWSVSANLAACTLKGASFVPAPLELVRARACHKRRQEL